MKNILTAFLFMFFADASFACIEVKANTPETRKFGSYTVFYGIDKVAKVGEPYCLFEVDKKAKMSVIDKNRAEKFCGEVFPTLVEELKKKFEEEETDSLSNNRRSWFGSLFDKGIKGGCN